MATLEATAPELQGSVRDIMITEVRTAQVDTSIADVATLIVRHNLRRIVVIDQQKKVIGVVSQRDILRSFLVADQDSGSVTTTRIISIVTRDKLITVTPDIPLVKAAVVLATNKIGCLPVVNRRGKLMGILSVSDLLKLMTGGVATRSNDDSGFKFYTPAALARENIPAFIRRVNGDLVVPLKGLGEEVAVTDYVLLGYDESKGQILIKFVDDQDKIDDVIKIKRTKDQAVIPASGFVKYFNLTEKTSVFDVAPHENGTSLLLTPRAKGANPDEGEELH